MQCNSFQLIKRRTWVRLIEAVRRLLVAMGDGAGHLTCHCRVKYVCVVLTQLSTIGCAHGAAQAQDILRICAGECFEVGMGNDIPWDCTLWSASTLPSERSLSSAGRFVSEEKSDISLTASLFLS